MPAKHLEASVRLKPGGTVLDLRGEINGFAQEALNAAYTEAEAKDPGPSSSKLCEKCQARASLLNIRRLITALIMAWLLSHNLS
ncbi:MAG TPA: hypothetical protein VE525_14750 [Rubrobacter sp.]|jgi:hypothetical protein|nr:hypothetical protein [Rubrobacter sp.]